MCTVFLLLCYFTFPLPTLWDTTDEKSGSTFLQGTQVPLFTWAGIEGYCTRDVWSTAVHYLLPPTCSNLLKKKKKIVISRLDWQVDTHEVNGQDGINAGAWYKLGYKKNIQTIRWSPRGDDQNGRLNGTVGFSSPSWLAWVRDRIQGGAGKDGFFFLSILQYVRLSIRG